MENGECLIAAESRQEGSDDAGIAPTPAEAVEVINKEYPHLKAKLDYMAEKMSSNMGIVSWPNG